MADVPHFSFPFRFAGNQIMVSDQGSDDEILDCVEVLLSTEPGERIDLPAYGLEDQTFRQGGASQSEISSAIRAWEPRALVEIDATALQDRVDNVNVRIRSARG